MRGQLLLHILAFAAVLTVNYLSAALPLNGKTPGALSDQYPNLFVPAGLTFAIWGIIYTWLLVWIGFHAVALFKEKTRLQLEPGLKKTGPWFILTCLLNIAWLFAWHWQLISLSVLVMIGLLFALIRLNQETGVGLQKANKLEKWLAHAPFGLYQGWITIALIANVTALLVSQGWNGGLGLSALNWTILLIFAGALLADQVIRKTNNIFHGLAVAWALLGIYLKRNGLGDPESLAVGRAALIALALVLFWVVQRSRRWFAY